MIAHTTLICTPIVTLSILLISSRSQETEYWFGEVYIPLALVLPYSDHIVHQEKENDPFQLLDSFERDITMPIEPKVRGERVVCQTSCNLQQRY